MIHSSENRPTRSTNRALILGALLAALMAACLLLAADPARAATTFTVNSPGDKGDQNPADGKCFTGDVLVQGEECTLRAAIEQANVTPGADTIDFDIPGTGVNTISPASELPTITRPVTIDGYSQQGAKPNTKAAGTDAVLKIELSGAGVGFGNGLRIEAANSTIKGLVINRWDIGISILGSGATGNKVTGSYLGTDASGSQDLGNNLNGVLVTGPNNTVGGTTTGARNVISGNDLDGVYISDPNATGNKIIGNYVGTDDSGKGDLGNNFGGVLIDGASNTVGGTEAGARNVISGNDFDGVDIFEAGATDNKVEGNYLGTDASGTKDLGNTYYGVRIFRAPDNTIGGATSGTRNIISGNNADGVFISGNGATGNEVGANYIGTDKNGTAPLGNSSNGVRIEDSPNNTVGGATVGARNVISGNYLSGVYIEDPGAGGNKVLGNYVGTDASGKGDLGNNLNGVSIYEAPNNSVGGARTGERNVIFGNGIDGVVSLGDNATGNRVLQNSIFANDGIGIDLLGGTENAAGVTANDPGDADTGPNNLQNFPVLSSARTSSAGTTTIKGSLNSTPNKTFAVRFFSNPSGEDEGKTFIGTKSVTTDASGNVSFTFSPAQKVAVGRTVTATATGAEGTSEFSAPRTVPAR